MTMLIYHHNNEPILRDQTLDGLRRNAWRSLLRGGQLRRAAIRNFSLYFTFSYVLLENYLPKMILHHIIPQKKLEQDYFDRLTLQIGISERQRTLAIGKGKYMKQFRG